MREKKSIKDAIILELKKDIKEVMSNCWTYDLSKEMAEELYKRGWRKIKGRWKKE